MNEASIGIELAAEIASAKTRKLSGEVTLTVGFNEGGISRASINIARSLKQVPKPREAPGGGARPGFGAETDG